MLRDLSAKTGIDFRAIEYKNSGYIEKAMRGREIDLWYTNKGLVEHHEGKQKCFYGTFNENSNGIIALNKLIEGDQAYASFMAYLFVNELFTDDLKKLLVQDVRTIIESANYQALLSQGGNVSPKGTKQEKINMVKRNARSYAKPHAAK
jgi:tripartite-type tricarboxylate transporter receptor subunit TctC